MVDITITFTIHTTEMLTQDIAILEGEEIQTTTTEEQVLTVLDTVIEMPVMEDLLLDKQIEHAILVH